MSRYFLISILALFFAAAAPAQTREYESEDSTLNSNQDENGSDTTGLGEQTTLDTTLYLNDLHVPVDSIRKWKEAKEFVYIKSLDSLLRDMQEKEKNKREEKIPSSEPGFFNALFSSDLVQVLLWIVGICFVLFIVYRLFLSEGVFRRETKQSKTVEGKLEEEEISADTDFDALISQALRQNNLRLAVRYQYLRSLHKLAGKQWITLSPDKTNYEYVRELKNPSLQNEFAAVTLHYEYVWYGEFELDADTYARIENGFRNFDKKI